MMDGAWTEDGEGDMPPVSVLKNYPSKILLSYMMPKTKETGEQEGGDNNRKGSKGLLLSASTGHHRSQRAITNLLTSSFLNNYHPQSPKYSLSHHPGGEEARNKRRPAMAAARTSIHTSMK